MSVVFEKSCPECGDRLNADAKACACGWKAGRRQSLKPGQIPWKHSCDWAFAGLTCKNPVGLFRNGEISGFCIFHRANPSGRIAADIAQDSEHHDSESYNDAARRQAYGEGVNPAVERMLAQIAPKQSRASSDLKRWIEVAKSRIQR